jgi:hypothetical protein
MIFFRLVADVRVKCKLMQIEVTVMELAYSRIPNVHTLYTYIKLCTTCVCVCVCVYEYSSSIIYRYTSHTHIHHNIYECTLLSCYYNMSVYYPLMRVAVYGMNHSAAGAGDRDAKQKKPPFYWESGQRHLRRSIARHSNSRNINNMIDIHTACISKCVYLSVASADERENTCVTMTFIFDLR